MFSNRRTTTTQTPTEEYGLLEHKSGRVEVVRIKSITQLVRLLDGTQSRFPLSRITPSLNGSNQALVCFQDDQKWPANILEPPKAEVDFVQQPGNANGQINLIDILTLVESAERAFYLAGRINQKTGSKRSKVVSERATVCAFSAPAFCAG